MISCQSTILVEIDTLQNTNKHYWENYERLHESIR